MAERSDIEWTDATFNPWWGCTKVSPACTNCYAAVLAPRYGHDVWGPKAARRKLSDTHWRGPLGWNAKAKAAGERRRVFCASMADVFEDRHDLDGERERLWTLIEQTPHLDWQLLTKRPQHISDMVPWGENWPTNVWIGTTVENQAMAKERLPHLVELPAAVRFISAEPLFSKLNLRRWIGDIDWVITGGESGVRARVPNPAWFQNLRDQCIEAEVPFFFKQWGEWAPYRRKAGSDARIEQALDGTAMQRVGKKKAGRRLDRRIWSQYPVARRR